MTEASPPDFTPRIRSQADLEQVLDRLPEDPGVYVMRDRKGRVVYVGKAKRLRVRVKQYFNGHDPRFFVPLLGRLLGDIETVVTHNDKEALLLENNLIKEHRPRFNVALRDDKNYLVLRLDPAEDWPRLKLVRNIKPDRASYFGPYHSAISARSTLRVVNRHFQLRTCTDYTLRHRKRPCLQYQIGRCPAPCVGEANPADYQAQVKDVALFLQGRHTELLDGLRHRMRRASEDLHFEMAARLRDQITSLETSLQSQRMVSARRDEDDVVGIYREGGQVEFVVLQIRGGALLGTQSFSETGMELPNREVLASFLTAYYSSTPSVPRQILLPFEVAEDDALPLLEHLADRTQRRVELRVPRRGPRKKLISLAARNAASNFATRRSKRDDSQQALTRLQTRLGLSRWPHRIECYDISHISGTDVVGAMVVFLDGVAEKSLYRSFTIRGLARNADHQGPTRDTVQNDDFASMYEVLTRRFRRALDGDDERWAPPDLVIIDGGKGQLSRAAAALADLGISVGPEGVDLVALAKERRDGLAAGAGGIDQVRAAARKTRRAPGEALQDWTLSRPRDAPTKVRPERVFVPGSRDPIALRSGSSERYLMERIRDEAHRFAITHHRKRRGKRSLESALDGVSGVGPVTKKALLDHFGSVSAMRRASPDALMQVRGVGPALAGKIQSELERPAKEAR